MQWIQDHVLREIDGKKDPIKTVSLIACGMTDLPSMPVQRPRNA